MILIHAIYINIGFFSSLFILSTLVCYILKYKCRRIIVIIKKNIEHLSSFMQNLKPPIFRIFKIQALKNL